MALRFPSPTEQIIELPVARLLKALANGFDVTFLQYDYRMNDTSGEGR
jgi:hypothetical protein